MGRLKLAEQSAPATPSSGSSEWFTDSSSSDPWVKNDAGLYIGSRTKATTAQIAAHSADTYYVGIQMPSWGMQAGQVFRWLFVATKGAAGVAAPVFTVRIGAAGTTADTSRLAITAGAQTAAADSGRMEVVVTCRSVGASGVLRGYALIEHNLAATGFASTPAGFSLTEATSAGFDNTSSAIGGLIIGLSVNPGASGAWVVEQAVIESLAA